MSRLCATPRKPPASSRRAPLRRPRARRFGLLGVLAFALLALTAQISPRINPNRAIRPNVYAITGATVITSPGTTIANATVVLRDGLVEAVGADVSPPADAEVIDASGMTVYAGWIDAYTSLALPAAQPQQDSGRGGRGGFPGQQEDEPAEGTGHPIDRVRPEYSVTEDLIQNDNRIDRHRRIGFTAALVVPRDGIYKGQAAVVALRDAEPRELVVKPRVAQVVAFSSGGFGGGGGYPRSLLGVIAQIRQTLLDAQHAATWQDRWEMNPTGIRRPPRIDSYPALQAALAGEQPVLFEAAGQLDTERALRIAREFNLQPIILGGGQEYEFIDMLDDAGAPVIVPVDYPDAPEIGDRYEQLDVSLGSLERWKNAPGNAAALAAAGIRFALTTEGLDNPQDFVANVRKAIDAGLSADAALAAVTTAPAEILGVSQMLGTVEAGKIANVVVATGALFAEDARVRHLFVDGHHEELTEESRRGDPSAVVDPRGTWSVTIGAGDFEQEMTWFIDGGRGAWTGSASSPEGALPFTRVELDGNLLTVGLSTPMGDFDVTVIIDGNNLEGSFDTPQGFAIGIFGTRITGPGALPAVEGGTWQ